MRSRDSTKIIQKKTSVLINRLLFEITNWVINLKIENPDTNLNVKPICISLVVIKNDNKNSRIEIEQKKVWVNNDFLVFGIEHN